MSDDDALRDRLRRSDPAASLEPLADQDVSRLLDRTLSDTGAQGRPLLIRYAKPIAAVVSLAAAALVAFVVLNGNSQPVVERVRGGNGAEAKCVPPSAEELRKVDVAVEGKVTSIRGGVVTLDLSQVWAGPPADVLEVAQSDGASESAEFAVGQTYLVAAQDGSVRGCGYTGVESPELRTLYGAAFGG